MCVLSAVLMLLMLMMLLGWYMYDALKSNIIKCSVMILLFLVTAKDDDVIWCDNKNLVENTKNRKLLLCLFHWINWTISAITFLLTLILRIENPQQRASERYTKIQTNYGISIWSHSCFMLCMSMKQQKKKKHWEQNIPAHIQ